MDRVQVPNETGKKILLSSYLMGSWKRLNACDSEVGWGITLGTLWSPAQYLKNFPLDPNACQQFAKYIKQPWKPRDNDRSKSGSKKRRPTTKQFVEATPETNFDYLPNSASVICQLCKKEFLWSDFFPHLEMEHSINRDQVDADPGRMELRKTYTKEILCKWSK